MRRAGDDDRMPDVYDLEAVALAGKTLGAVFN